MKNQRMKFLIFAVLGMCVSILAYSNLALADETAKPNIIVIMADDMGFSDLGCYGGEIDTPNLDGLAAGGLRYSQFYNTARCCPTRASLLTGLYPHQARVGHMMADKDLPGYQGDLGKNCVTIAEVLNSAGYSTYMSGKWHVTKTINPKSEEQKHNWPRQRGFDRFFGTIHGAGSLWDPNTLTRGNTYVTPENDPEYQPDGDWYYTDAISDNAANYVRQHKSDAPFFMYVAYTAPHWPMHAREKDIAKYKGKYDDGFGAIRKARYEKLKEIGLIKDEWALSDQAMDWEKVKHKQWEARNMEVFAAMIDSLDQGVGRIIDELKTQKKFDNTLILFLQDNGGCAEGGNWLGRGEGGEDRADKASLAPLGKNGLQTKMIPDQTRDGFPVRKGTNVMAGPADTYIGYGRGWANVSNTPFREYKHWVHEGGISSPLIAHWPKGLKRKNEIEHQPSHLIDIMATCVSVSGATYPLDHGGTKVTPMQGKSLVPTFTGGALARDAIYFEHEGNRAVRTGKWKLVAKGPGGKWELFDMEADRTETNDLARQYPEKVKELSEQWTNWASESLVTPWPWKNKKTKKSE